MLGALCRETPLIVLHSCGSMVAAPQDLPDRKRRMLLPTSPTFAWHAPAVAWTPRALGGIWPAPAWLGGGFACG